MYDESRQCCGLRQVGKESQPKRSNEEELAYIRKYIPDFKLPEFKNGDAKMSEKRRCVFEGKNHAPCAGCLKAMSIRQGEIAWDFTCDKREGKTE